MNSISPFSGSNNQKLFEIPVRYDQIMMSRQIVEHHPVSKKCLEAIYNRLFKYGVEIKIGQKMAKIDDSTRVKFSERCKTFCIDFIKCYYEMGIVPVSIAKNKNGERYPVVMKDMGIITIAIDPVNRKGRRFQFYKLFSKSTNKMMSQPKLDKSTVIFSGYGHDPDYFGEINSLMFSAIKRVMFTEKMFSCAFLSEDLNSKPVIVTEITNPELFRSGKAMGTNIDVSLWYGNRDRKSDSIQDQIQVNDQELQIMEQFNRSYIQSWNSMMQGTGMTMSGMHAPTVPLPVPIRNVPPGQHVTNGTPRAQSRGDLIALDEREEEILSSLYSVPKTLFSGETRTVGGTQVSSEMFAESIMGWRGRLSVVLTQIFKCIYTDKLCDIYEDELKTELQKKDQAIKDMQKELEDNGTQGDMEDLMRKIIREKEILVGFPVIPYENVDELWKMYLRGVLPYTDFIVYAKMSAGLTITDEDREAKEPWKQMFNMMLLSQGMDPEQQMLFQGRFAPQGAQGEKKDKKKNKEKKEPKEKKDKKRKESEEPDSKQEKEKKKKKDKDDAKE
jgi:hypothetical protein